jgi:hypothetical protein
MAMKIAMDVWKGTPTEEEAAFELQRIAKLVTEGYNEGEIFSQGGGRSHKGYNGWWKLRK